MESPAWAPSIGAGPHASFTTLSALSSAPHQMKSRDLDAQGEEGDERLAEDAQ